LTILFVILHLWHHCCVNKVVLISWILLDPFYDALNSSSNVLGVKNVVGVLWNVTTLIKEWCVNKVPITLPWPTSEFDCVSECWGLNEWVVSLSWIQGWILLWCILEEIGCLSQSLWVLFLKLLISNSWYYKENDFIKPKSTNLWDGLHSSRLRWYRWMAQRTKQQQLLVCLAFDLIKMY